MDRTVSAPDFWQQAQQAGQGHWNLGTPTPVFVNLLAGPDAPKPGRIAIPGFGSGYDALRFARAGFEVVGFDFADYAVSTARASAERQGLRADFRQADLFALPRDLNGTFDYVLEYTCFCAIDPARRGEYVDAVHRLLRPGGEYIALFYPLRDTAGGPPFAVREDEIRRLFEPRLEITSWVPQPAYSVPARGKFEALVRMRKR